jgi:integrase
MIRKSDAVSIFRATRGSRSIEISVPGSFTAVRFLRPKKKPGASAADRGRPSLFKTIDEDQRERHDHINRSGRSTYPERISVLTSGATPELSTLNQAIKLNKKIGNPVPALSLQEIKKYNQLRPFKGRLRYLSKEEEVRLLAALDPENYFAGFGALTTDDIYTFRRDMYDLVIVLLDTGARYSEAAGLPWESIDLKNRKIALYRSKVNNESTLQMTARVHKVLTRRFESRRENQKFVFESQSGTARRYAPGAFVRACKRCGIEGITLHSLRHTFASRVVQAGLSLVEIQNLLGHASPITSLRYAHLAPNQAASKAVMVLDNCNGDAPASA